jgi:hypothetical protein
MWEKKQGAIVEEQRTYSADKRRERCINDCIDTATKASRKRPAPETAEGKEQVTKRKISDPRMAAYGLQFVEKRTKQEAELRAVLTNKPEGGHAIETKKFWSWQEGRDNILNDERLKENKERERKGLLLGELPYGPYTDQQIEDYVMKKDKKGEIQRTLQKVLDANSLISELKKEKKRIKDESSIEGRLKLRKKAHVEAVKTAQEEAAKKAAQLQNQSVFKKMFE